MNAHTQDGAFGGMIVACRLHVEDGGLRRHQIEFDLRHVIADHLAGNQIGHL